MSWLSKLCDELGESFKRATGADKPSWYRYATPAEVAMHQEHPEWFDWEYSRAWWDDLNPSQQDYIGDHFRLKNSTLSYPRRADIEYYLPNYKDRKCKLL